MATRVVLFDIDGTLVLTGGAGARAMIRAFGEVYGVEAPTTDVPFAGRTDTWIIGELARRHGREATAELFARFRQTYLDYLGNEVHHPGPRKGVLPGVRRLLEELAGRRAIDLALLTGNLEGGARVKLEYFDLWRYFKCGAYADDAPDRNSLFACALARLEACGTTDVDPADVVIVGDTPLDIGVAVAAGARSVGVATGSYDGRALAAAGADAVLEDLSDVRDALRALGVET